MYVCTYAYNMGGWYEKGYNAQLCIYVPTYSELQKKLYPNDKILTITKLNFYHLRGLPEKNLTKIATPRRSCYILIRSNVELFSIFSQTFLELKVAMV